MDKFDTEVKNEVQDNGTEELDPITGNETEGEENSSGKLGLLILVAGATGVVYGGYRLAKAVVDRVKGSKENDEPNDEKPAKEKVKKIRGRKLTLHEKITGHIDLDPSEVTEEEVDEE